MPTLTPEALATDLAVRDLADPAQGPHAIQAIVTAVLTAVTRRWPDADLVTHRGERIVDVADNYDRLGYSAEAATRDSRYTRYVDGRRMLRSQTSALIPGALRALRAADALVACPGIVYRRDSIDRLHTGTPHQLDLWRITRAAASAPTGDQPPPRSAAPTGTAPTGTAPTGTAARSAAAGPADLIDLIATVAGAALPGTAWRTRPAAHPYTTDGLEIEAWDGHAWVEIGEGGVAAAHVVGPGRTGLALGLGLDRLVMLRKGIDDIRLLRSADPRVRRQMADLRPYRPVSAQPAARRDLSVALPAGVTAEDLGDRVRELLGPDAHLVEEVTIESTTPESGLPAASRERLRLRDGEVNVLLRVVLRDLHAALTKQAANALRDRLYAGLMGDRAAPAPTTRAPAPTAAAPVATTPAPVATAAAPAPATPAPAPTAAA